ncbi:small cysteine-rich protein [Agaricus bisporus var. bisporus H97]|uniref:small cysteine-rich protein n=1 Tax=Agaricus bisporus var. bisporus (strain H97 / ATCC MYA-4626 / FGSC 10389) TaxID=936046 RepID=UPI00029F7B89|nr:small cysteine-rich protein [Agaricus bisporus var. bisporus H97]EKV47747.1 small cysteine-rich protein [Agaricus bisporus var. bisporus H97]
MNFKALTMLFSLAFIVAANPSPGPADNEDICLRICYHEKPDCEAPSYAKYVGECWTCCTPQY